MHPEPYRETIRERLERDLRQIRELLEDAETGGGLVLEKLPNGEWAWLKPNPDARPYTLTDKGRRAIADVVQP